MNKNKTKFRIGLLSLIALGAIAVFVAADHIDSPSVAGTSVDIADLYAFEGSNTNNTVFVATLQGPLAPGSQTDDARFDEDVLIEFNIDNTGDFVEDLVIQAIKRGDSMYFFGPTPPTQVGLSSMVQTSASMNSVKISAAGETLISDASSGMRFFAGPRRDAFYFDFNRFNLVITGQVAPEGFLPPAEASDLFENLNVLAVVVEVPNELLGDAPAHVAGAVGINGLPNAYNVWVSTKRKQ